MKFKNFILSTLITLGCAPLIANEIHYPDGEQPIERHIRHPLTVQLPRSSLTPEDKKTEAMALYLKLLREDEHNIWAPFQLAAALAETGQTELAERYLQISADRGLWYYYSLLEERAFSNLQHSDVYHSILAETRTRHQQYATQFEGKFFYTTPNTATPTEGWPVIVYLHPYGKAATISPEEQQLFTRAGIVFIAINGTEMLAEESFRWSNLDEKKTHQVISRALKELATKYKLNQHQIYLSAHGQGALHAANLLAKYPKTYAGALLASPLGELPPARQSLAKNKRVLITSYDPKNAPQLSLVEHFTKLFNEKNQVKAEHIALDDSSTHSWQEHYYQSLSWVVGKALLISQSEIESGSQHSFSNVLALTSEH
ncbi:alpha/beta hydrolase [Serratia microhaemolytica]|uniref:alpha/beta hydrolase n=1 Tax=Serratia microhaemolytica TaxID=2675110 RepID=UPI001F0C3C87|nr:hypothetical protein [Serratia microhaemolytica]